MRFTGTLTGDDGRQYTVDLQGTADPTGPPPPPRFADLYGTAPTVHMQPITTDCTVDTDLTLLGYSNQANVTVDPTVALRVTIDAHMTDNVGTWVDDISAHPDVEHVYQFVNVDETKFVGGDIDMTSKDAHHTEVVMMVSGGGRYVLKGAPKTPWTRLEAAAGRGVTTLRLREPVQGWRPGDELAIAPTEPVGTKDFAAHDEVVTVESVNGQDVTLTGPLAYPHPVTLVGNGLVLTAEVVNLTRNLRIEGLPGKRFGGVHVMSSAVQDISHVQVRYSGPRQPTSDGFTQGVLGRYGFHWHRNADASRGTVLDGCVVRDSGNHAYVPHASHGVTMRGCTSYNTFDEAYWWDQSTDTRASADQSNDTLWDSCIALRVSTDPDFRGYRLAGFTLGAGSGNTARGCVAVGVQGTTDAAGFGWPEVSNSGVWTFTDNVAHNNTRHGIFTWQNNDDLHDVGPFTAYNCGGSGISHGAYGNRYTYRDLDISGCGEAPVTLHACSSSPPGIVLRASRLDANGRPVAVALFKHNPATASPTPTVLDRLTLTGYTKAAVAGTYDGTNGPSAPDNVELRDCTFLPGLPHADLTAAGVTAGSQVREFTNGSELLPRVTK